MNWFLGFQLPFRRGLINLIAALMPWAALAADLKLGRGDRPSKPPPQIVLTPDPTDKGRFSINVSDGPYRLIRYEDISSGVILFLNCAQGRDALTEAELKPGEWKGASGKCSLEIRAGAAAFEKGFQLPLIIANETQAKLRALNEADLGNYDPPRLATTLVATAGKKESHEGANLATGGSPRESRLGDWVQLVLLAIVAVGLLGGLGFLVYRQKRLTKTENSNSDWEEPEKAGGALAAYLPRSDPVLVGQVQELRESVGALQRSLSARVEALEDSRQQLGEDLEQALAQIKEFNPRVEEVLRHFSQSGRQIQEELVECRNKVAFFEAEMEGLRRKGQDGLQNLLGSLSLAVLGPGPSTENEKAVVLKRIEEAVASYLRNVPQPQTLEPFLAQATQLLEAVTRFQQEARAVKPGSTTSKLAPVLTDLRQIRDEIEQFLAGAAEHRLRLSFCADFSTLQQAQQTLTQSIAAGLQREAVKLDNPLQTYTNRLTFLGGRLAAETADLADAVIDVDRKNTVIQDALRAVFQACLVEEIAPRRNDPFLAREHSMVQMMRRSSDSDRSGAVAQLVTRGLRQGDRVVRKAAVMIFE